MLTRAQRDEMRKQAEGDATTALCQWESWQIVELLDALDEADSEITRLRAIEACALEWEAAHKGNSATHVKVSCALGGLLYALHPEQREADERLAEEHAD